MTEAFGTWQSLAELNSPCLKAQRQEISLKSQKAALIVSDMCIPLPSNATSSFLPGSLVCSHLYFCAECVFVQACLFLSSLILKLKWWPFQHAACPWEYEVAEDCIKNGDPKLNNYTHVSWVLSNRANVSRKCRVNIYKSLTVGDVEGLLFGLKLGTLIPLIPPFYCQLFPSCHRICTEFRICATVHHSSL